MVILIVTGVMIHTTLLKLPAVPNDVFFKLKKCYNSNREVKLVTTMCFEQPFCEV